jgi:5-amino-6-(5-phosphoribosylamino)uracil reductase
LEEQMAVADAILVGSGTLNDGGNAVLVAKPELVQARLDRFQSSQPIQIICSRSGKIDRELPFFSQPISRWLLTTQVGSTDWVDLSKFDRVLVCETADGDIDWLTVCPFIYGGSTAPSPVSGMGFTPESAPRLELLSVDRISQEIFLNYRVTK